MLNSKKNQGLRSYNMLSHLAVPCGIGLLLGIGCLWSPLLWILSGLVGALVGGRLIYKRPEIALLGILVATSTIIFEERLPLIPIGVGSLQVPDILLLGSFGLIFLRWIVKPEFKIVRTPLDWPLLAFCGLALLSTAIAILGSSLDFNLGMREFRYIAYYLTFFVVTNLVREDYQLRFLMRGFFLFAIIVAVAMGLQFLVGDSLHLLPGRVETLRTQGVEYTGTTRILPPGQSIIVVAFIASTVTLLFNRNNLNRLFGLAVWGLTGLALIVSFTRGYWVQAGLAMLLFAYLVSGRERLKLVGLGLVVLLLVSNVILLVYSDNPDSKFFRLTKASYERLATLGSSKTLSEGSLRWRYVENQYVLPQILSHPLLGLGMGAEYRPYDHRIDYALMTGYERKFIHNAHFWIMMKAGLPAYLCLMWLSVVFLARGFKYWRLIPDLDMRAWVLGFTLAYMGVLIGAVIRPLFVYWNWTPLIGIMMGINEVVFERFAKKHLRHDA